MRAHSILGVMLIGVGATLAQAQDVQQSRVTISEQFFELCGTEQSLTTKLPGDDVPTADAPLQLKYYAEGAFSSRIVKIRDRFAMRSQNPGRADPVHSVILRCALTGNGSNFSDEVGRMSEKLAVEPSMGKTQGGFDSASFRVGQRSFVVFAEDNNWLSIFSMDIMMRNIDRKYIKKGAKPVAIPPAQ